MLIQKMLELPELRRACSSLQTSPTKKRQQEFLSGTTGWRLSFSF
jgi:hypothetical protein